MVNTYLITGRIIPERKSFNHPTVFVHIKEPEEGIDAQILVSVNENQLVASVTGDIASQSIPSLNHLISHIEQAVLNVYAFIYGAIFDVEINGLLLSPTDGPRGAVEVHYRENVHDIITRRNFPFTLEQIWTFCQDQDGLALRMCLNDLRMALKEVNDGSVLLLSSCRNGQESDSFSSWCEQIERKVG